MSFSVGGTFKTKSEARKVMREQCEGNNYCPGEVLPAVNAALDRMPPYMPEGKAISVSVSGHAGAGDKEYTSYSFGVSMVDAPAAATPS